jgi:hypothetical protein
MKRGTLCACVVAAAALIFVRPSLGDEGGPPKPIDRIDNPFLQFLAGSWNVGMPGMAGRASGVSLVQMVAGDTAIYQQTRVTVGGRDYYGVNVIRQDDNGRTVKIWKFDSMTPRDVTIFTGSLRPDGLDAGSDTGESIRLQQKGGTSFEATVARKGQPASTSVFSRTNQPPRFNAPDALKKGLHPQMIGTWAATGEWTFPSDKGGAPQTIPMSGTSRFEWALGGAMMAHYLERTSPMGPDAGFGLHRWGRDGTSSKVWFFGIQQVDPLVIDGHEDASGWHGRGKMPDGTMLGFEWTKEGAGFAMQYLMNGQPAGSEKYERK